VCHHRPNPVTFTLAADADVTGYFAKLEGDAASFDGNGNGVPDSQEDHVIPLLSGAGGTRGTQVPATPAHRALLSGQVTEFHVRVATAHRVTRCALRVTRCPCPPRLQVAG